jgi:hypothetical protein
MKIGNTYFNKEAKALNLKEFTERYKGKLDVDIKTAYKQLKKSK